MVCFHVSKGTDFTLFFDFVSLRSERWGFQCVWKCAFRPLK